jgi:hypothetical protein
MISKNTLTALVITGVAGHDVQLYIVNTKLRKYLHMKLVRWLLAIQKREDAKWLCIARANTYSLMLAIGDEAKLAKYEVLMIKTRNDYIQLTWANI